MAPGRRIRQVYDVLILALKFCGPVPKLCYQNTFLVCEWMGHADSDEESRSALKIGAVKMRHDIPVDRQLHVPR